MNNIIKRLVLFIICVFFPIFFMYPAQALEENGIIVDLSAEECGVLSLSVPDQYALIGRDVSASSFDGVTSFDTDFDCISPQSKTPLSITLLDNTILTGEDASEYLNDFEQYLSFNAIDELPNEMPKSGTSQKYICSVCDLSTEFTVYYFDTEDKLNAALVAAQANGFDSGNNAETTDGEQISTSVSNAESGEESDITQISVPLPILIIFGVILAVLLAICATITIKYLISKQTTEAPNESNKSKKEKGDISSKDSFAAYEEVFDE